MRCKASAGVTVSQPSALLSAGCRSAIFCRRCGKWSARSCASIGRIHPCGMHAWRQPHRVCAVRHAAASTSAAAADAAGVPHHAARSKQSSWQHSRFASFNVRPVEVVVCHPLPPLRPSFCPGPARQAQPQPAAALVQKPLCSSIQAPALLCVGKTCSCVKRWLSSRLRLWH